MVSIPIIGAPISARTGSGGQHRSIYLFQRWIHSLDGLGLTKEATHCRNNLDGKLGSRYL